MQKLYVVVDVQPDGSIKFPMAGGRNASIDSARAFQTEVAAKRSLSYIQNRQAYGTHDFRIMVADTFTELQEETE